LTRGQRGRDATEVLQGSKDGCLIGYVDIERLGTGVAYLRERFGRACSACDRPAGRSAGAFTRQRIRDSGAPMTKAVGISSASLSALRGPCSEWCRKIRAPIPHCGRSVVAHGVASLAPLSTAAPAERRSSKKARFRPGDLDQVAAPDRASSNGALRPGRLAGSGTVLPSRSSRRRPLGCWRHVCQEAADRVGDRAQ